MQEKGHVRRTSHPLVAAVAAADGEIRPGELEKFRALLVACGASENLAEPLCQEALDNRRTPLKFIEGVGDVSPDVAQKPVPATPEASRRAQGGMGRPFAFLGRVS